MAQPTRPAIITAAPVRVGAPPRPDGYRPLSDALWVWARLLAASPPEEYRLLSAAARRLDSGHRQIERVRDALDSMAPIGSPAGRTAAHDAIGDAELAVIAIDMALRIAGGLNGRYRVPVRPPRIMADETPLIRRLRDHYAHIDERALGRVDGRVDADAESAYEVVELIRRRVLSDGRDEIGIDAEMTALLVATRRFLADVWVYLVDRSRDLPAPPGDAVA